jgi:hypothetical protein
MKLLEVAPDFVKSQAGVLMTMLQYLEAKTKPGTHIPMGNISKLMNNAGYSFSYENLQELIKSNTALEAMISDYSKDHIVLGKESIADKEPDDNAVEKDAATVDQMANRAAQNPIQPAAPSATPPQF